jgi:hypothetical protein
VYIAHTFYCIQHIDIYAYFFLELHKQTIKLLTGIKYEIKSLAYSVECLKNISKTIVEKLSTNESIATQGNYENATFYDDWPIECESDLNHQEECLKDVTKRNTMARYSDFNIYIIY